MPVTDVARLEKQLYRTVRETCESYALLAPGDRVLVAMSGGKDSYTLFHLLTRLVPRLPFAIELVAVHLDQVQPDYDGSGLRGYLDASGWPDGLTALIGELEKSHQRVRAVRPTA